MTRTIVGFMDSMDEARSLIEDLIEQGIAPEAIGILARESEEDSPNKEARDRVSNDQMAGVTKGFGAGAGLGGVAGLVAGIAAFSLPGVGAVVAGPIAAALAGLGIGAFTGGVFGAIRNLGLTDEEARYYAEGVSRGGILVSVQSDEAEAERVEAIMRYHGSVDIVQRTGEWKDADREGYFTAERPDRPEDRPHH